MTTTAFMNSLQNLTEIAADLTANGKKVSVKVLPTRHARKGETIQKDRSSGRSALGTHDTGKGSYVGKGDIAIGAGRMGTLNPVNSLGRQYTGDKAKVAAVANAQYKADRRAAALDRLAGY